MVGADKSKHRARPQDTTVNDVSLENCKPFSREALATSPRSSCTEGGRRAVSTHVGMHTRCRDRCRSPRDGDFWSPQSFLRSRSHSPHHESPWILNGNLFCSQASELHRCQTDMDAAVAAAACDRSTQREKNLPDSGTPQKQCWRMWKHPATEERAGPGGTNMHRACGASVGSI